MGIHPSEVIAHDPEAGSDPAPERGRRAGFGQSEWLLCVLVILVVGQQWLVPLFDAPALRTWSAMFVAIVVQSLPFLVLGILIAAAISTLLTEPMLRRVVPRNPMLAVPVAGVAGIGLIGCECASVPIAQSVMRRGVAPGAALTFLLAAPAVNPVVLVSTAVAFPNKPEMVLARFVASMATAVLVGWIWVWRAKQLPPALQTTPAHHHARGWSGYLAAVQHDFMQTAGFLVLGATLAAAVNSFVPPAVLERVAGHEVLAVVVLALFAFVVALCSQTDAFIAASFVSFSYTARLVFLVVGPAMDIKLAILEAGSFGHRFVRVFAPLVVVVAMGCALVVGGVLL